MGRMEQFLTELQSERDTLHAALGVAQSQATELGAMVVAGKRELAAGIASALVFPLVLNPLQWRGNVTIDPT